MLILIEAKWYLWFNTLLTFNENWKNIELVLKREHVKLGIFIVLKFIVLKTQKLKMVYEILCMCHRR